MRQLIFVAFLLNVSLGLAWSAEAPVVDYAGKIHPFFHTYCTGCHNHDEPQGGLNLESFEGLKAGGEGGQALFIPGKADESRIIKVLIGTDKPKMPPKKSRQPTETEIALLKSWINAGAKAPPKKLPKMVKSPSLVVPRIAPRHPVSSAISSIAVSPKGDFIAATRDRQVLWIESATGKVAQPLTGDDYPLNAVAVSRSGDLIAAAGGAPGVEGKIFIWSSTGKLLQQMTGHTDSIYGLDFSPDGKLLVSGSYDKLLKLWDVASGKELNTLKHHTGSVFDVCFSPDGKYLASVAADMTVKLWDVKSGQRLVTITDGTRGMNTVCWRPDGKELAAAGIDKTIRTWSWDGKSALLRRSTFAHDMPILRLQYSGDGKTLFSTSEDRWIKVWDVATLNEKLVYENQGDWPLTLAVMPDQKSLAVGFFDGSLKFYSTTKKELGKRYLGPPPVVAQATATGQPPAAPKAEMPARPARPILSGISPKTVTRGKTVAFTLTGKALAKTDQLYLHPGFKHKLLPADDKQPDQIRCEIEIPANATLGSGQIRLHTPQGSTEQQAFVIGPFEELGEQEPNDAAAQAQAAPLPRTLTGAIGSAGDRDLWQFEAQANQEVVFELEMTQIGSQLDPRLTILSADGQVIAEAARSILRRNVFVGFQAKTAGKYLLQVEDRNFTGGGGHTYHIYAGSYAYVTSLFPTAFRTSDKDRKLAVMGFNLGGLKEFSPKHRGVGRHGEFLETPRGTTLRPVEYDVTDWPELVEQAGNDSPATAQPIPVPSAVSGRVDRPGSVDEDDYVIEAKQGDRLIVEVQARRQLFSPLDSELTILTPEGKRIARYTVRPVAETTTVLRDHDSRSGGIRIQNYNEMTVNDYVQIGTEIIKVRLLPRGPDDDMRFVTVDGTRAGFFGTTPQAHAMNSPVYKVEVFPPGKSFPPNGMPVTQLYFENDDGGASYQGDSSIPFDVPATGKYVLRVRDVRHQQGPAHVYRLIVRPRQENFRLSVSPGNPNIPAGGALPVNLSIDRLDGFEGAVDVQVTGLPPGVVATSAHIEKGSDSAVLTLTAPASVKDIPLNQSTTLQVWGTGQVGSQQLKVKAGAPFGVHQVSISPPADITLDVSPRQVEIRPGQELTFTATIQRQYGFKGRVQLDVINLPEGLTVQNVGLNGVLINEDETSRVFTILCESWAHPGDGQIYVKNDALASPEIKIRVSPAKSNTLTAADAPR